MQPVPLNRANLVHLQAPVQRPGFNPIDVTPGIVHLGLGGFHRAHMARYTHNLMNMHADARNWGIIGAGLMPSDRRMQESLNPQDNLYTLVERSAAEQTVTVVASLTNVIFAGDSSAALLDAIDKPGIRIVSLTVTENGYCLNRSTKQLDPDNPLIRADLAHPERPSSAIGIIVEACRRRRQSGIPSFAALSCDNIQHNGRVLRQAVLALATLRDPELASWISENISFPSTMVDRITPVTANKDVALLAEQYGIIDRWPVFAETFTQWVIEDRFPCGRPAWEDVGAQFVDDVAPYEFMKLRLLNASHLAIAGLGRLAGYVTIDEAMADPLITRYMVALMDRETEPTLPAIAGIDLSRYKATLVERFANPAIRDTVERVNTDAPLNILVDPIRDRLCADEQVELLALGLAAWLRRICGEDEQGQPIDIRHPLADQLREKAIEGGPDPRPLLGISQLFGDIGDDPRLIRPVSRWLEALYARGSRMTLNEASRILGF